MINKGSKAYSILQMKCPKCHEGNLFETGAFSFNKPFDMPEKCPVCQQKYFLEPGFIMGPCLFPTSSRAGFACFLSGG